MNPTSSAPPPCGTPPRPGGRPGDLRDRWAQHGGTPTMLADFVKSDLRRRFAEGERPAVTDYLELLPELGDDSERMLSLIYEEFCLREEAGEAPDPDSFCDRYEPWRDSLASQLNYHRMLSQAAGVVPGAPPRFPEPGEDFQQFRLKSLLGQGGAARVFLADDVTLGGRQTALKVSPDRGEEPSIMGRLKHPHIMPVHTVVRDSETGLRGLCMPYMPGRPLDHVLRRMENIPPARRSARTLLDAAAPEDLAERLDGPGWGDFPRRGTHADACAWLAVGLAEALDHAHALGILHRDVKPANVLLSAAEGPQLLDFNLAHDPNAPERAESALRGGTLPYMAPEQLEAFRDPERWDRVGPTADLYALGLLLRELLTGRRPEAPPADLPLPRAINDLLAIRADGWPPARAANPAVPHALDAIIRRCLAPAPADRYPSAVALAEDLRAFLHRRPLAHACNPSRRERSRNWLRRNRVALLMTVALLLGPAAGYLVVRETPEDANRYNDFGIVYLDRAERSRSALKAEEQDELLAKAGEAFRRALALDPRNVEAYQGLGRIALVREDVPLAIDRLNEAVRAGESRDDFPPDRLAEVYRYRAEALILEHDHGDPSGALPFRMALEDLDRALRYLGPLRDDETTGRARIRTSIEYWRAIAFVGQALLDEDEVDVGRLRLARKILDRIKSAPSLDPNYLDKIHAILRKIEPFLDFEPALATNHGR